MSSSQNESTLGEGGVLKNEQGQTRGGGGAKLGNLERMYFLNVPFEKLKNNFGTKIGPKIAFITIYEK